MDPIKILNQEHFKTVFDQEKIDFVPDPMVLRTADLFFNGKKGLSFPGNEDQVWREIHNNLPSLYSFFDILMTRTTIPFCDYWLTFPETKDPLADQISRFDSTRSRPISVDSDLYKQVVKGVMEQYLATIDQYLYTNDLVAGLQKELESYSNTWYLSMPLPPDTKGNDALYRMKQFLIASLVFGLYAQLTGADHIMQSRYSSTLLQITAPGVTSDKPDSAEREKEIFEKFKDYCRDRGAKDVWDLSFAPNVLPYLIKKSNKDITTKTLLENAFTLRVTGDGPSYRTWFQTLKGQLAEGENPTIQMKELDFLQRKLDKKFKKDNSKLSLKAGISVLGQASGELSAESEGIKDFFRTWRFKLWPAYRHQKLIYRMYVSEMGYFDLSDKLRKIWYRS